MNLAEESVTLPLSPCPWGQTAACGSQPEHASPGAGPARAAAGFCQISWARRDRPLSSGEMAPFLGGGEDIPRLLCSCSLSLHLCLTPLTGAYIASPAQPAQGPRPTSTTVT